MYIYFSFYIVFILSNVVIGVIFSDNVACFTSPSNHDHTFSNVFAKIRIRRGFPSDGKKFTLEDLIDQNIIPQPPIFNNDPGYNQFHKINYRKLVRQHLKEEDERVKKLDGYFTDSKKYSLIELLNILNECGIYPFMTTRKTIEMINRFNHSIREYKSNNNYLNDDLIKKIHENRSFLRIIGSIRRRLRILKKVIVRSALLDDIKIKRSLPQFTNQDIVDIFELLSLTKYKNDVLMSLLISYVEERTKNFTITEISNIMYYISKLNYNSITIVKNLTSSIKELNKLTQLEALHVAEALVSCDYIQKDVFDTLSEILFKLKEFKLDELIRTFKAFSSAEYINEDFYNEIINEIIGKLGELSSPNLLLDLLSSISHMNIRNERVLEYVTSYINDNFSSFSPMQLASIAKYFAMLQYYANDLLKKIFDLPVFSIIPDVEVMNHIRMGYHKSQSYTAYLHKYPLCELDKLYNKIFIAYKSYQLESTAVNKFKFNEDVEMNLRDICTFHAREKIFSSSSLHLEIADIYKNIFNINFDVGVVSQEGFIIDLAYITEDGTKFAIKVNGPFSFMQRCLGKIPPPHTASSMLKERLLKRGGWNVLNINYWDYVTWFSYEKKKQVLFNILPPRLRELCKVKIPEVVK